MRSTAMTRVQHVLSGDYVTLTIDNHDETRASALVESTERDGGSTVTLHTEHGPAQFQHDAYVVVHMTPRRAQLCNGCP